MFRKPSIYVSHPIRPNKYTREENIKIAESCASKLRNIFPEVQFYFPFEGEPIFQAIKEAKLLTEDQLIDIIDLKILSQCHTHLCLYWDSSHGCIKERNFAIQNNIPSHTIPWFVNKASYMQVRKNLSPLIQTTIERFRNG